MLGGILGFSYAWVKEKEYSSTTTFVLENGEQSPGLGQYAGLASMVGLDLNGGGGIFQGDNIIELYKSRTMIKKALLNKIAGRQQETLVDRYLKLNELDINWASQSLRAQDSLINKIVFDINNNYLKVGKPDKKLNIIQVEVKSKDEDFSKAFNDEIVKTVNDFYIQTKTKKSLQNVNILQQKVDSVRAVMNGAIFRSATIADATPNLNPTRQVQRTAPMQRSQFSAETNKEILGELVKNLELSKISLRKETPLIQVIDVPVYPLKVTKPGTIISILLGGFIFGLLSVIALAIKKSLADILIAN